MRTQDTSLLRADEHAPVRMEIITGGEKGQWVTASVALFEDQIFYVIVDRPLACGTTVCIQHDELTIVGEVVRCERANDFESALEIKLQYASASAQSLVRLGNVLAEWDAAQDTREEAASAEADGVVSAECELAELSRPQFANL